MRRLLEDWELDALADGFGTEAQQRALTSSPADQQRLRELRVEEAPLRAALFRAACPPALTLGEWQFGMLEADNATGIQRHVAECPHCAAEVTALQAAIDAPAKAIEARQPVLKRLVMTLQTIMGSVTMAEIDAPVLRGETWSGLYASGDYMISLTRRRGQDGYALLGSVIMPEPTGRAQAQLTLKQSGALVLNAPLTAAATFSFDALPPGAYELIVTTPSSELVVSELEF